MKKFFEVKVNKYVAEKDFSVYRPASLNNPKDNAVMFIGEKYIDQQWVLLSCNNCLVFWPEQIELPFEIEQKHAVVKCIKPRRNYCLFFRDNGITSHPAWSIYWWRS